MRRIFTVLAPSLLVLTVVTGVLLMHGFEAVSPEPLATHTAHEADDSTSTMSMVGLCVFVAALAVMAVVLLPSFGSVVPPSSRRPGRMDWRMPVLRGPPDGFSYERCVIRV
ncbi:MAG: hypothetical protein WD532_04870 [Acidimicrobiia bacterium]